MKHFAYSHNIGLDPQMKPVILSVFQLEKEVNVQNITVTYFEFLTQRMSSCFSFYFHNLMKYYMYSIIGTVSGT